MDKEKLKTYRELKHEWDDIRRRISELEAKGYGPRSQLIDGMPHGGSGESYAVEERMDQLSCLVRMYTAKEAELVCKLIEIEDAIKSLRPRESLLMRLHYIDGLTWENVAVAMGYSWRQVHRIHSDALERLKDDGILKGEDKDEI